MRSAQEQQGRKEQSQRRVFNLIPRMVFNDRPTYKDRRARNSSWPGELISIKTPNTLRRLVSSLLSFSLAVVRRTIHSRYRCGSESQLIFINYVLLKSLTDRSTIIRALSGGQPCATVWPRSSNPVAQAKRAYEEVGIRSPFRRLCPNSNRAMKEEHVCCRWPSPYRSHLHRSRGESCLHQLQWFVRREIRRH